MDRALTSWRSVFQIQLLVAAAAAIIENECLNDAVAVLMACPCSTGPGVDPGFRQPAPSELLQFYDLSPFEKVRISQAGQVNGVTLDMPSHVTVAFPELPRIVSDGVSLSLAVWAVAFDCVLPCRIASPATGHNGASLRSEGANYDRPAKPVNPLKIRGNL